MQEEQFDSLNMCMFNKRHKQNALDTHLVLYKWSPCLHGCGQRHDNGAAMSLGLPPPSQQSGKSQGTNRKHLRDARGPSNTHTHTPTQLSIRYRKGNKEEEICKITQPRNCECPGTNPVDEGFGMKVNCVHVYFIAHAK